jgi:hypothetical protein
MGLLFWRHKDSTSTHAEIRKVNFLIHPGFAGDMRFFETEDANERMSATKKMFGKYKAKAETLGPDEALVAFSHHRKSEMGEMFGSGDEYNRLITDSWRDLRSILGKRLVVMSFDQDIFGRDLEKPHNVFNTMDLVKRIMRARGLPIHEEAKVFAFGESLGECVVNGAMALNIAGEFKGKVCIITALCDVDIFEGWSQSELSEFAEEVRAAWPRVRLD